MTPPCVSEEEEEPPANVEEEEEPPPTSPLSRPMKHPPGVMEEQWCDGGWSFPPPTYAREEEWCGGGWSFPPRGVREEERHGSREKQTSRSSIGHVSSRILNAY
jgi:hypothetical protein